MSESNLRVFIDIGEVDPNGHVHGWPTPWGDAVEYVPRPGTCATCKHFHDYQVRGECSVLQAREIPYAPTIIVPQNGSGFCHNHENR